MTNTDAPPVLSVIIGVRDWEIARLRMAIKSHLASTIADDIEIVISDYGSQNKDKVEALVESLGCVYVYTADNIWSRSRALNAGIVASRGTYILTTDADFIFTPQTHAIVLGLLKQYPNSLQLKQNKNLPEGIGVEDLEKLDWADLDEAALTRPRWGMGGLAACHREMADRLRGYDERMTVWGAEDNDFGKRVRNAGGILNWIADDAAQVFHVWHPPFLQTRPDASEIAAVNHTYLHNDNTIIRNLHSGAIYRGREPLVSVVMTTRNRAEFLKKSIESVLRQTFREFELIVIDDASCDHTSEVIAEFQDPRLRYVRNETPAGVGAARNQANAIAAGRYIAIHDDGDIMLPWRLEKQLGAFEAMMQGVYGGWFHFDSETEQLSDHPGKAAFGPEALYAFPDIMRHATLMVEKRLLQEIPYLESFEAGSDYNTAFRMAWNAARFCHCGAYVTLNRQHSPNTRASQLETATLLTRKAYLDSLSAEDERKAVAAGQDLKDAEISLLSYELLEVQKLLSIQTHVQIFESPPKPLEHYTSDTKYTLLGRVCEGEVQLIKELYEPDESDQMPSEVNKQAGMLFNIKDLNFAASSETNDTEIQLPMTAASILASASSCIVLETGQGENLSVALSAARHLLPEREDIAVTFSGGRWLIAFEQGASQRQQVIERKNKTAEPGFNIYSVSKVRK